MLRKVFKLQMTKIGVSVLLTNEAASVFNPYPVNVDNMASSYQC